MVFERTDAKSMSDLPSVKELREYAASCDVQPTGKQVAKHFNIEKNQMKELRKRLRKVGDGKGPKIVSFFANKARGAMARFIQENRLNAPDQILDFDTGGYAYVPELSTPGKPAFLRTEAAQKAA